MTSQHLLCRVLVYVEAQYMYIHSTEAERAGYKRGDSVEVDRLEVLSNGPRLLLISTRPLKAIMTFLLPRLQI